MAICPSCKQPVFSVTIEEVDISSSSGKTWRGINHSCPRCHVVLSVGTDPIALKDDIVAEITANVIKYLERSR
jgi:hypothetical protein